MARTNGRVSCALLAFSLLMFTQLEGNVDCANEIPTSMLRKMMSMRSAQDFINNMMAQKNVTSNETELSGRKGRMKTSEEDILFTQEGALKPSGVDNIADKLTKPAHCVPSIKAVPIPRDNRANSIFWPICVNVQRCGGCCGVDMLSCVPTSVKMITVYAVNVTYPYPGAELFDFEGTATFQLEEHLGCECRCALQSHHCHPKKHRYIADSCRCQCKNSQASTQCPLRKKWDEQECTCVCEKRYRCYNNEWFDSDSCSCQRRRGRMSISTTGESNPCAGITCGPNKERVINGNSCLCKVDPCKELTCRAQFEPVRVGRTCECRYMQSAGGDTRPGSLDVFGLGERLEEEEVDVTSVAEGGINLGNLGGGDDVLSMSEEEPTTTTERPPSRRTSRDRRPSSEHSVRPGSMIEF